MLAQLCLILYSHMDCSLPGSSVHGISHVTILEWILQGILLTQGSNLRLLRLLHWQADSFTTAPFNM